MAGLAGFGQGFSNAINANSANNLQDAHTKILQFQQESLRRAQLGDIYGARALKLMADQMAGMAGIGGPPVPPGAQPPMPGTQSMPAPAMPAQPMQAAAVQQLPPQPPMGGVPLPPYQSLPQPTQPLSLGSQGGSPIGLGNFSTMPDQSVGMNPERTLGPAARDEVRNGQIIRVGDVGVRRSLGLDTPEGWGAPGVGGAVGGAEDQDQPGGPPPSPAVSPVVGSAATGTVGPAVPPGTAGQPAAPIALSPTTGLPHGPQLSNNLNALNAIKALKQIGAPDDVIMAALGHMEPIFATEYKATIAAQNAAINAYRAEMLDSYHQGRLSESEANRTERAREADNKVEQQEKNRDVRKQHHDQQSKDYNERSRIMEQRVKNMPNPNSPEAQAFKYAKQLADKAHADLHNLYQTFSKASQAEKPGLDAQINAKQIEINAYTNAMTDAYNKIGAGKALPSQGGVPTQQGVPLPPKAGPRVTATNPKTGEKVELRDGKWVPLQ
jgi:hypothetical protein